MCSLVLSYLYGKFLNYLLPTTVTILDPEYQTGFVQIQFVWNGQREILTVPFNGEDLTLIDQDKVIEHNGKTYPFQAPIGFYHHYTADDFGASFFGEPRMKSD